MSKRKSTRIINIGGIEIGGGRPVAIQSMTKTDTRNKAATIAQIKELEEAGCEIVRVAVPDMDAADSIVEIKRATSVPLIADIHFDYRLALAALEAGVDGLRLNPGNIRDRDHIAAVVDAARERSVPIRVGVNAGSLPPDSPIDGSIVERMVSAALDEVHLLEDMDFELIKISVKAFDVPSTIEAYRAISKATDYPLHLGITEAGLTLNGAVRSAVGIGILLYEGIGDTIRVSLTTSDPCKEVECGYDILKSLNMREKGPVLVSCPTCGRCETNLIPLAEMVDKRLKEVHKTIRVAVMGCEVNGPGEAKDADVGVACGKGRGLLFRRGKKIKTVPESGILDALMEEIDKE